MARLLERDPTLWLSRSWTTRERRPGEADDAYTFVDRPAFERRIAEGGFLEWAEFLGNLYGTPYPEAPPGHDVVLEIDVQGATQVRERDPGALLIFLEAPSEAVQEQRLRGRGDATEQITRRLLVARVEAEQGRALGATFVVNDRLEETVDELLAVIAAARSAQA